MYNVNSLTKAIFFNDFQFPPLHELHQDLWIIKSMFLLLWRQKTAQPLKNKMLTNVSKAVDYCGCNKSL